MSKVEIDNLDCEYCKKITIGELDIKTGIYRCMICGEISE